jgi:hypothetical protein
VSEVLTRFPANGGDDVVPGVRRVKMAVRAATGLILHLHGGMLNFIFMFQEMLDAIPASIVIVRRDHLNMERHHRFFPTSQTWTW